MLRTFRREQRLHVITFSILNILLNPNYPNSKKIRPLSIKRVFRTFK
jgi:hypothetical protein